MPVSLPLLSSSSLLFYRKGIGAQLMTLTPVTVDQSLSHMFSLFASFAPDTRSGRCPVVYSPTLLDTVDWAVLLFISVADVQKSCHLVYIYPRPLSMLASQLQNVRAHNCCYPLSVLIFQPMSILLRMFTRAYFACGDQALIRTRNSGESERVCNC